MLYEVITRDLHNTKIIRSREQPHSILKDACVACHPKETFDFWLLIYKGTPPSMTVDMPERPGSSATPTVGDASPPAKKNRYNSYNFV